MVNNTIQPRFTLPELLQQVQTQESELYMLVDIALVPDLWDEYHLDFVNTQKKWRYLYQNTAVKHLEMVSPLLVQINPAHTNNDSLGYRFLSSLLQHNNQRWGCVFTSPYTLDDMLTHWQSWLTCHLPNGTESLFRCYSPSILTLLCETEAFDEEDKQLLTRPFYSLLAPETERQEQDQTILLKTLIQNEVPSPSALPDNGWLHIDAELMAAIDKHYHPQRLGQLAIRLFKEDPGLCMSLSYKQVVKGLNAGLHLAQQLHYLKPDQQAYEQFALNRFIIGSEFFSHPQFAMAASVQPLTYALHELSEQPQWQQNIREQYHRPDWISTLAEDAHYD